MKSALKLILFSFLCCAIYACTSPVSSQDQSSSSDDIMPKEFGDRFSSDKIKKEREAYYAQKRLELRKTSPSERVTQALRRNDIYLMGVAAGRGSSFSIPGLIEPQAIKVNCKVVNVEGMGDVLYGKNHIRYRQEMLQFMQEFNSLMSTYCK